MKEPRHPVASWLMLLLLPVDRGRPALASSPQLVRLASLDLIANGIGDAGIRALASSPRMVNLSTLHLLGNAIGDAGMQALASSPHLSQLSILDIITDFQ